MAVTDILPGIEILVCVEDEPLLEIPTENDDIQHDNPAVVDHQTERTVTHYIPSTTGKTFTIHIIATDPFELKDNDIIFNIEVDGHFIKAPLMLEADYDGVKWEDEIFGPVVINGRQASVLPMKFAKIKTTSTHMHTKAISSQKKKLEPVGTIEISVYRGTCTGQKYSRTISEEVDVAAAPDFSRPYHMKAVIKENISHGSTLAKAEPTGEEKMFVTEKIDGEDFPIAIFRFKYRSEKALKELGVAPRTPSPEPSPVPVVASTTRVPAISGSASASKASPPPPSHAASLQSLKDTIERQKRQLDEILNAALAGSAGGELVPEVKKEKTPIPGIKREHPDDGAGGPVKKRKKQLGKVTIDLTSDDEVEVPVIVLDDD